MDNFKSAFEKAAAIGPAAKLVEALRKRKGLKAGGVLDYNVLRKEFIKKKKQLKRLGQDTPEYSKHLEETTKTIAPGKIYRKAGIATNVDPKTRISPKKRDPI